MAAARVAQVNATVSTSRYGFEAEPVADRTRRVAALLAHGILQQYRWCKQGEVVGRSGNGAPGTGIPLPLRQAQGQLARLALEEGLFDTFSSIHGLLTNCQQPFKDWAPTALATNPELADLVLIDPDYRVPTEDCELLAADQPSSYADLVEVHLFTELQAALADYPDAASSNAAYTTIRQFIAEYPLATRTELDDQLRDVRLNEQAADFLARAYEPAHAAEAHQRQVPRCAHCRGRLSVDTGECALTSCRYLHPQTAAGPAVPLSQARLVRPELLRYWADPAQEELWVYRALRAVHGEAAVWLYPHRDRCDVSLGDAWGIDVKDHYDPQRLARHLNEHLGGLVHYPPGQRILAIATRRATQPHYLTRLRQALLPAVRAQLQVLSVAATIKKLSKLPRGTY